MAPSFTRVEYWLLEAAVERAITIAETGNGDAAAILNRPDHGAPRQELIDALVRLSAEGWIVGVDFQPDTPERTRLTRDLIEFELSRPVERHYYDDGVFIDGFPPDARYYELTPQGGAAWEAFARPNWEHYIGDIGICNEEDMTGEATCINRKWLERYVGQARWPDWQIVQESAIWDIVEPWRATYWKSFPSAHRVRFRVLLHKEPPDTRMGLYAKWDAFRRHWYRWQS